MADEPNKPNRPIRPRQGAPGRKRRVVIDSQANRPRQDSRTARETPKPRTEPQQGELQFEASQGRWRISSRPTMNWSASGNRVVS